MIRLTSPTFILIVASACLAVSSGSSVLRGTAHQLRAATGGFATCDAKFAKETDLPAKKQTFESMGQHAVMAACVYHVRSSCK